jgi:hypothetical protein
MRRLGLCVVVACALVLAGTAVVPAGAGGVSVEPFRQVGAWIDVFDYAPRLQNAGTAPRVTPDSVADMAALGVRTLYVQVANPDGAPSNQLTDRAELRAILQRAHDHDMAVIPWFLPALTSPADDLAVMKQVAALRAGDASVDGIGLDLESTEVADVRVRNRRAVAFARQVRTLVGGAVPVASIVYPAVQLEVLNPTLWPDFPYRALAKYTDVWMPMTYYTYRSQDSGLRSAYRYTVDSVDRLRRHVGSADARVHLIGGLAEDSTPADYLDMSRATRATRALGWSIYDYATTGSWSWPYLRGEVPVPTTLVPPTTLASPTTGAPTTTVPPTTGAPTTTAPPATTVVPATTTTPPTSPA